MIMISIYNDLLIYNIGVSKIYFIVFYFQLFVVITLKGKILKLLLYCYS
jgi:hypothetical protein